jgi:hypothetical protein
VDDARGASALIAAVRSARVLNGMTREEAERANVETPESYFNVQTGKSNLAPRSDKATWRHIIGVALGNGTAPHDQGDYVAVVEAWTWPDPFADVSADDAKRVQQRIAASEWRADYRSDRWAGKAVAETLGMDLSNTAARARVRSLLKTWISTGALREIERLDERRKPRRFVEVGRLLP